MKNHQSVLALSKEKSRTFCFWWCLSQQTRRRKEERGITEEETKERKKEKKRRKTNNNIPACPINKKNHTLPVTFKSNGIAYLGFCSKSFTAYQIAKSFLFGQEEIFLLLFEFELMRWDCWDF